jgi:hypothetical protein
MVKFTQELVCPQLEIAGGYLVELTIGVFSDEVSDRLDECGHSVDQPIFLMWF